MSRPQQPVFQRSSSGGNLQDMGLQSVRRSTNMFQSTNGSRQSLAPGGLFTQQQTPASASVQRRSSIYSRPSNAGPMAHQSFFTQAPAAAGVPKDPRPLKDRSYQARISQELLEYLTQYNFEMEMKYSLSREAFTRPTQKDFNYMFQWLYKRLDPAYRFMKGIDAEVPPILKQLRYPYERSITKSQIAAVGGNNWPIFLGVLHWMMQLAQMQDRYMVGAYDEDCSKAGVDVTGDRVVFSFLFRAYHDWLQVNPEADDNEEEVLKPHIEEMAAEFEQANAKYIEELKMLEAENKALADQLEELEKGQPDIAKLDKHFQILESDKKKFEEYNNNVQGKIDKYDTRIKFLSDEISKAESELSKAEEERLSLQGSVDKQGLNIQDIDRMNTERDRLTKAVDETAITLDETNRHVLEVEANTARRLEDLETLIKRYNSLCYQISLIPASASNAKGSNYELSINVPSAGSTFSSSQNQRRGLSPAEDRLLASSDSGHSPHQLLTLDIRGNIRQSLLTLRKEINERRKAAQESDLNNREVLDSVHEALAEKHSEVETLNHRVHTASQEYEKLKETTQTSQTQSSSQIERMEKELGRMRSGLDEGVLATEQREMQTNLEYERLVQRVGEVREELHTKIANMLDEVIKFKVHIQKGLGDFEEWVVAEQEEEMRDMEGEMGEVQEGLGRAVERLGLNDASDEGEEEEEEEEYEGSIEV